MGDMDLSAIIEKLMNDSSTADMIAKIKSSVENDPSVQSEKLNTSDDNKETSLSTDSGDLADKLPLVMGALGPLLESGALSKAQNDGTAEKRNRLLFALRPFLNEGRQGMLDKIMTVSKITRLIDLLPRDK